MNLKGFRQPKKGLWRIDFAQFQSLVPDTPRLSIPWKAIGLALVGVVVGRLLHIDWSALSFPLFGMALLPYYQANEAAIGANHPTWTDSINRPLREFLRNAGLNPDSTNISVPSFSQTVNAGSNAFSGTKEARITAAVALAVSLGWTMVYIPIKAWDGLSMLPYNASLVTFNVNVNMIREGGNPCFFDVRAYGAAGNAIQDDTAAFVACIAGCLGTGDPTTTNRVPVGPIYLSGQTVPGAAAASLYLITSEILIRSAEGIRFIGEGPDTTQLIFGANLTNGLNLDGVAYGIFEHFSIQIKAGFQVTNPINLHWGAGTHRSVTGCIFRNIQIGVGNLNPGFINGFALGTDNTTQVDGCSFERVVVFGNWAPGNVTTFQNGFLIGNGTGGNNLDHCFYNCEMIGVRNGYNLSGANGFFYGGQNELCETDFVANQMLAPVKISGFRSEQAFALCKVVGGSGSGVPFEVENVVWYGSKITGAGNFTVIQYDWSGSLILRNITVRGLGNVAAIAQVSCAPNTSLTVMVDGYTSPNSQTIAQTFPNAGGFSVSYVIKGYCARNAAETLFVNQAPFQMYTTNVSPNLPPVAGFLGLATGVITPTEAVLVSGVDVRAGNTVQVTLTAARLVGAPLNPTTGQSVTFTFIQGGAGAFAVTWNAVFKKIWSDAGNAIGTRSSITFVYDGTNWNQASGQALYV